MSDTKKFAAFGLVAVFLLICIALAFQSNQEKQHLEDMRARPLAESRENFKTELTNPGPVPGSFSVPPPEGVMEARYFSNGRQLTAWVLKPESSKRLPGVLFAHDGHGISSLTVEKVRPLANSGYIVMIPTWRGEHGNTGNYEMCFGEVEDAKEALRYLESMPEVDRGKLFAVGEGMGSTIVLLLAQLTDKLSKVAVCGGNYDMVELGPYDNPPFKDEEMELRLRSPALYVNNLNCPALIIMGSSEERDRKYLRRARKMKKDARELGKYVVVQEIASVDQAMAFKLGISVLAKFFKD